MVLKWTELRHVLEHCYLKLDVVVVVLVYFVYQFVLQVRVAIGQTHESVSFDDGKEAI